MHSPGQSAAASRNTWSHGESMVIERG